MKIYSISLYLKRASICSITMFFLGFFICYSFEMLFNTMFCVTFPFAVCTFICYSSVCIIDNFIEKEKNEKQNNKKGNHIKCKGGIICGGNLNNIEKSSAC